MNKERAYYIKPFTKAWFINIWYHYKIHILIGLLAAFILGMYTYEMITKPKYDFSIIYISDRISSMGNEMETLAEKLDKIVPDVNGDKKFKTDCRSIFASKELAKSDTGAKAQLEKAEIEVRNGETSVYLFGNGCEQDYVGNGKEESLYDLTELADKYGYSEDQLKRYPDGRVYAISMEQNPLLDFNTEGVYLVVRPLLDDSDKEKAKYEAALQMAEYIISRGKYEVKR